MLFSLICHKRGASKVGAHSKLHWQKPYRQNDLNGRAALKKRMIGGYWGKEGTKIKLVILTLACLRCSLIALISTFASKHRTAWVCRSVYMVALLYSNLIENPVQHSLQVAKGVRGGTEGPPRKLIPEHSPEFSCLGISTRFLGRSILVI